MPVIPIPEHLLQPNQQPAPAMPTASLLAATKGPAATFEQIQQVANQSAPDKRIQTDETDFNGKPITVFSLEGPRTESEFVKALDAYNSTSGKQVNGFTFLPKDGFKRAARNLYEQGVSTESGTQIIPGNQALQGTVSRVGESLGDKFGSVAGVLPHLLEKLGIVPPGAAQGVRQQGAAVGKAAGEFVGSTFSKPENAASTVAQLGMAAVTGGTSIVPQVLKMASAGGLANFATQQLFGTSAQKRVGEQLSDAGKEAFVLGAAQGGTGVIKRLLGSGVSDQAMQGTATKMADLIKTKYRQFVNDPTAIDAIASTDVGLRDLAQIKLTSLRGSSDEIAKQFSDDVVKMVGPRTAGNIGQKEINTQINKFVAASDDLLNNVGNGKAMAEARIKMQEAAADLTASIKKHTPDLSNRASLGNTTLGQANQYQFGAIAGKDAVSNMMFNYMKNMQGMVDEAHVLHGLKVATEGGRFNLKVYQKTIMDSFRQEPGSLMDQVGQVALRGKGMTGTDTTMRAQIPFGEALSHVPGLNMIPGLNKLNIGKDIGERFTGTVPGQSASFTAAANIAQRTTLRSMQDYMNEGEQKP